MSIELTEAASKLERKTLLQLGRGWSKPKMLSFVNQCYDSEALLKALTEYIDTWFASRIVGVVSDKQLTPQFLSGWTDENDVVSEMVDVRKTGFAMEPSGQMFATEHSGSFIFETPEALNLDDIFVEMMMFPPDELLARRLAGTSSPEIAVFGEASASQSRIPDFEPLIEVCNRVETQYQAIRREAKSGNLPPPAEQIPDLDSLGEKPERDARTAPEQDAEDVSKHQTIDIDSFDKPLHEQFGDSGQKQSNRTQKSLMERAQNASAETLEKSILPEARVRIEPDADESVERRKEALEVIERYRDRYALPLLFELKASSAADPIREQLESALTAIALKPYTEVTDWVEWWRNGAINQTRDEWLCEAVQSDERRIRQRVRRELRHRGLGLDYNPDWPPQKCSQVRKKLEQKLGV